MTFSLKYFLSNLSLRKKMIVFFCVLLIIPIVLIGVFTYNYFIILIEQKSIAYNSEIQKLMIEKIDKYFSDLDSASMDIAYSTNVQEFLIKKRSYFRSEVLKDTDLGSEVQNFLFTKLTDTQNIQSVCIFGNDSTKKIRAYRKLQDIDYNYEPFLDDSYSGIRLIDRNKLITQTHFDKQLLNSDEKIISLVHKIYNIHNYSELGILVVNISLDAMKDLCRDILRDEGVKVYITDQSGFIIYSNNQEDIMMNLLPNVKKNMTAKKGSFTVNSDKRKLFVTYDTSDYTGWKIAISMPYNNLAREGTIVGIVITAVIIIICGFLLFLIMFVTSRITFPIKRLEECMQRAEDDNFSNRFEVDSNDEIGHLGKNFNNLMDKINELFSEIYREQGLKREAEINALQAQINPHFLYNTLNTLKWMAVIQKADKMVQVIDDLIALLRFTAKKTNELIPISEEVETLKKYVNIQKFRYYDRFDIKFEIPESLNEFMILKFTLQPIVENAIFHGFESLESDGIITVKAVQDENDIIIYVTDNGKGMDEEKANEILLNDVANKDKFNKIGVNNVHQRIKLHFGDEYGLKIDSSPSKGTLVEVRIPVIPEVEVLK